MGEKPSRAYHPDLASTPSRAKYGYLIDPRTRSQEDLEAPKLPLPPSARDSWLKASLDEVSANPKQFTMVLQEWLKIWGVTVPKGVFNYSAKPVGRPGSNQDFKVWSRHIAELSKQPNLKDKEFAKLIEPVAFEESEKLPPIARKKEQRQITNRVMAKVRRYRNFLNSEKATK